MIHIELINADSYTSYGEWYCDDDEIVDILGEPLIVMGNGTVLYYDYGGKLRLIVDSSVSVV